MHPAVSHSVVSLSTCRRPCYPCNVAVGYRKDASRDRGPDSSVVDQTACPASVLRAQSSRDGCGAPCDAEGAVGPGYIKPGNDPSTG